MQTKKQISSLLVIFFLFSLSIFSSPSSQASISRNLNYQGLLADSLGVAVPDGSYTLHLKIYTVASGGVAEWSSDQSVTTSNGIFSTLLDLSTAPNLLFDASAYYLGVAVGSDPEMTPRKQLGSVPQAMNANNVIGDGLINITGNINTAGAYQIDGITILATDSTLFNTFIGEGAGTSNTTTGTNNFFGGYQAGYGNTTGDDNVYIGPRAGFSSGSNYGSVFIGADAGRNTADMGELVFIGARSGYSNVNGYDNVFIGYESGYSNTDGWDNTFIGGWNAGHSNTTGIENISLGSYSLYSLVSGNSNTAIGHEAGRNTLGSGNVLLGYNAGYNETGSNKLYIENSNSATPLIYGEFDNDLLQINGNMIVGSDRNDSAGGNTGILSDLFINRDYDNYGPGTAGIYVSRSGNDTTVDGGNSWKVEDVDSGIAAYSYYGNSYNAAISGHSYLDYISSAAVLGAKYNGSVWGALGYNDGSDHWAGFFNGNAAVIDDNFLGTEILTNGSLTAGASWTASGDVSLINDAATWISGVASSNLTQAAASLAVPGKANRWYKLSYTVSAVSGRPWANIGISFAEGGSNDLVLKNGSYSIVFKSNSNPTDFQIAMSNQAGDGFTIDSLSLREVTGGDLVVNRYLGIGNSAPNSALDVISHDMDGATAVATSIDTSSAWTTNGSKLLSVRNNGTEQMFVDDLGGIWIGQDVVADMGGGAPGNGGSLASVRRTDLGDPNSTRIASYVLADNTWNDYGGFEAFQSDTSSGLAVESYDTSNPDTQWSIYTSSNSLNGTALLSARVSGNVRLNLEPTIADGASAVAYEFDTSNLLANANAKLLSIQNQNSEKFTILGSGNVGIGITATALLHLGGTAGKVSLEINSNETTATNNVLALRSDVALADDMIFRVQANGAVFADGAYTGTGADYAEYFKTTDTDLLPGEAVCIDPVRENAVKRCQRSADNNVMGIISDNPSIVGNSADGRDKDENYKIVAMLGQIKGKVSTENGAIQIGDSLTSASAPGYLRKANAEESTVGIALQNSNQDQGTIQILISRRNKSLTVEKVEEAVSQRIAEMNVEDQVNALITEARAELDESSEIRFSSIDTQLLAQQNLITTLESQVAELQTRLNAETNLAQIDLNTQDAKFIKLLMGTDRVKNPEDVDILGKLSAKTLSTGGIEITVIDPEAKTIGEGIIKAGEKNVVIETKAVKPGVQIFVTPKRGLEQSIGVSKTTEGESFAVELFKPELEDLNFGWWIVETK